MSQAISDRAASKADTDRPPTTSTDRAVDAIDYDLGYRQRKRGIYALTWATVVFFVGAIAIHYAIALAHGYGTGFGDGRERTVDVIPWSGTGFWGDLGILAGTFTIDMVMLYVWYYAASRLDSFTKDDPVAPDDPDVDLNDASSWYVVQVPRLTKSLYVVAVVCLLGIVLGAALLLPVVTIRYGFVI